MYLCVMPPDRKPLVSESTWAYRANLHPVLGRYHLSLQNSSYYHNGAVACDKNFKNWPYWKEFI